MTLKEIYEQHHGKVACYKGKRIGAFIAGYCGDKYLILGFKDETGCIRKFTPNVVVDDGYVSYRFAKEKYVAWING